jgi:hypothetical protein
MRVRLTMDNRRRSEIWKMPKKEFAALISRSRSIKQVAEFFGMSGHGNSYHTLMKRIKEDGIDISLMPSMKPGGLLNEVKRRSIPLDEIMIANSTYDSTNLKKRLIRDAILENKCALCGIDPTWNGKPLNLRLDHINGVHSDNRMGNLRLICPNCDSQLDTYCGRNRVKNRKVFKNCKDCGKKLSRHGGSRCRSCNNKQQPKITKISWPTDDELLRMVRAKNNVQVARKLGVSEMAVRKRLKRIGLIGGKKYRKKSDQPRLF